MSLFRCLHSCVSYLNTIMRYVNVNVFYVYLNDDLLSFTLLQGLTIQTNDDDGIVSSSAPPPGGRGRLLRQSTKQSVKELLSTVESPDIT